MHQNRKWFLNKQFWCINIYQQSVLLKLKIKIKIHKRKRLLRLFWISQTEVHVFGIFCLNKISSFQTKKQNRKLKNTVKIKNNIIKLKDREEFCEMVNI